MNIFINEKEQRPRAGWRLLLQFVIMFFLLGFAVISFQAIWQNSLILATAIPQFIGMAGSVWIAARLLDRRSIADYGLQFNKRWLKDFLAGALIAAVAMACIFGIEKTMGWLRVTQFGWHSADMASFTATLINLLVAMLLVGFHEELFSRGYQVLNLTEGLRYPKIGERGAVAIAVLVTSTLFGLLHFNNPNASIVSTLNIILAGVVLALPYVFTGSLALSVGLHFGWNFVQGGIFGFPVSGLNVKVSVIETEQLRSDIWTGGAFGPEAGVIGIFGMAIMMGLSLVYIKMMGFEWKIAPLFKKRKSTDEQGP